MKMNIKKILLLVILNIVMWVIGVLSIVGLDVYLYNTIETFYGFGAGYYYIAGFIFGYISLMITERLFKDKK